MTTTEQAKALDIRITADEHARAARAAIAVDDEVRVSNHPAYIGRVTKTSLYMLDVLFMNGSEVSYGRHEVWPESVPLP